MHRISKDSLSGVGRAVAGSHHKIYAASTEGDENLDLFSGRRRSLLISSAAESNGHSDGMKLRSGMDDLLSDELGKHDYDWLLTPPGTPLFSSSNVSERQSPVTATKNSSTVRSITTAKSSRLSMSQSENGHSTRPARSISATRPSISTTSSSSYLSNNNRTSILNTSSASITSRPSTPGSRSTATSVARTSTPASRPVSSRSSTPTRTQPPPTSLGDKPKRIQSSRPSTPTSRPQTSSNSSSLASRTSSRPSTPTQRTTAPAPTTTTGRSTSVGRASTTTRPASRPSSPAPRARTPVHPINIPDFPHDVPPNLRTKLPERPASAGRSRPGMVTSVRATANSEAAVPVNSSRRQSSPVVSRGRLPENSSKARSYGNGNEVKLPDMQKSVASEVVARKPSKPVSTTESTGFGRTISKKSLDMALRHMDIRQNMGGVRGTSLFPRSIRSTSKGRPARTSDPSSPASSHAIYVGENGNGMVSQDCSRESSENGDNILKFADRESLVARANEAALYGSYRYDAILLKEDSKNTNWLHNIEDKSDHSLEFDHRSDLLPEPFSPL